MGCHTWFFKKTDVSTEIMFEKAKEYLYTNDHEYSDQWKKVISFIINNKLDEVLYELVAHNFTSELSEYHNGWIYEQLEDDNFHDLFRWSDYNQKPLSSSEETFKFLEEKKDFILSNELLESEKENKWNKIKESLNKFWDENTDGLITFG